MNTDLDQTLTESDIEYHSQSSYALETYPVPCNFLLQIPDSVPQCLFKKPSQSTNQRCVVLFRNLIYEQVTHRFDKAENMHEDNPSVFGQFKFFLNTLEILCHYLKVIDLDDYAYRVKDYGIYKVINLKYIRYLLCFYRSTLLDFHTSSKLGASSQCKHTTQSYRMKFLTSSNKNSQHLTQKDHLEKEYFSVIENMHTARLNII